MKEKIKKTETRWPQVPVCFYVPALALETPEEAPKTFRCQDTSTCLVAVVLGEKYLGGNSQRGFEGYETEHGR